MQHHIKTRWKGVIWTPAPARSHLGCQVFLEPPYDLRSRHHQGSHAGLWCHQRLHLVLPSVQLHRDDRAVLWNLCLREVPLELLPVDMNKLKSLYWRTSEGYQSSWNHNAHIRQVNMNKIIENIQCNVKMDNAERLTGGPCLPGKPGKPLGPGAPGSPGSPSCPGSPESPGYPVEIHTHKHKHINMVIQIMQYGTGLSCLF